MRESRIIDFINHDYLKNNIYLFLRTSDKENYTYMGLLAYVDHDNQREKPVYFKWQILDWNDDNSNRIINDKKIDNKRIEKLFGNLDYGTGMDCDLEMKYKYFKY